MFYQKQSVLRQFDPFSKALSADCTIVVKSDVMNNFETSNGSERDERLKNILAALMDDTVNGPLAKSLKRATCHYDFVCLADRIREIFYDRGFHDATPTSTVITAFLDFMTQAVPKLCF